MLKEDITFLGGRQRGNEFTVRGIKQGNDGEYFDVNARFYEDGEAYVRDLLKNNRDEVERALVEAGETELAATYRAKQQKSGVDADQWLIDNMYRANNPSGARGAIGEEIIQRDLLKQSEVEYNLGEGSIYQRFKQEFDAGSSDSGLDGMAVTEDGRLVLIETKTKKPDPQQVTNGYLGDSNDGIQFGDDWIEAKFDELADEAVDDPAKLRFLQDLDEDGFIDLRVQRRSDGEVTDVEVEDGSINADMKFIAIQDGPINGRLAKSNLRNEELSITSVDIAKIGGVFTMDPPGSRITSTHVSPTVKHSVKYPVQSDKRISQNKQLLFTSS